jgi:hypothetical protein
VTSKFSNLGRNFFSRLEPHIPESCALPPYQIRVAGGSVGLIGPKMWSAALSLCLLKFAPKCTTIYFSDSCIYSSVPQYNCTPGDASPIKLIFCLNLSRRYFRLALRWTLAVCTNISNEYNFIITGTPLTPGNTTPEIFISESFPPPREKIPCVLSPPN